MRPQDPFNERETIYLQETRAANKRVDQPPSMTRRGHGTRDGGIEGAGRMKQTRSIRLNQEIQQTEGNREKESDKKDE